MNFFERQDAARGATLRLVALFVLAVIVIVVVIDVVLFWFSRGQPMSTIVTWLIVATAVTLLIIGGGSISKTIALRAGGSAVALSVGAVAVDPTTSDPALRRFVNVVEEMSLASGVPMPRLFVLEQEAGINAFAAGYTPADAAVTVTGGALHQLNRDELQGVIGHEFSHILNGDMRLNIRLVGLLNGILLLGLIGLRVLAFGGGRRGRSDRDGGAAPILLVAVAMMILGFVGQFFAGLIKAAVSRQREWLADASSVQFTREAVGLEGALKKIAGLPAGSQLADRHSARQISHMLFGEGGRSFSRLFATHPPLMERIAALDPSFRPDEVDALRRKWQDNPPNGLAEDASAGLVGHSAAALADPGTAAPAVARTEPGAVAARVATIDRTDLQRGAELSAQIPARFRQLASQPSTAVALVLAMALDAEPDVRAGQLRAVAQRLGRPDADTAAQLADEVRALAPQLRLPLLSIAAPLLAARPQASRDALAATLDALANADGELSLFEYCLTRLVGCYLHDASDPGPRARPGRARLQRVPDAALALLAALAAAGNCDPAAAQHAFQVAAARLLPGSSVPYRSPGESWRGLDSGWAVLDALDPRHKGELIEAMVAAVRDDGVLRLQEAELLRTACSLLHCPLPSFVA